MSGGRTIVVGTRGSALALAQAELAAGAIRTVFPEIEVRLKKIGTTGDRRLDASLRELTAGAKIDKGLFTRELEMALQGRAIDVAVHSLKDLPTTLAGGLKLAAVLPRENVEDVLVMKVPGGWDAVPPGGVIATGSLRRRLQILRIRPDLSVVDIRGNVPTRLRKLVESSGWHALVLARAGLNRLGYDLSGERMEMAGRRLHITGLGGHMRHAVGQGAIGLECRTGGGWLDRVMRRVNHQPTWACVRAERALLSALGGGCQTPLGVRTRLRGGALRIEGELYAHAGARRTVGVATGPAARPAQLARRLAAKLLR